MRSVTTIETQEVWIIRKPVVAGVGDEVPSPPFPVTLDRPLEADAEMKKEQET